MATINKPIMLDETGVAIAEELARQNMYLAMMAEGRRGEIYNSMEQIANLVKASSLDDLRRLFPTGDQIIVPWKDMASTSHNTDETAYQVPIDIVHKSMVALRDGSEVPGLFMQWHYCTPFDMPFDAQEAFYVAENAVLPAGTYNVTMGFNWGTNVVNGKTYQFTLTNDLPVGGQLAGFYGAPDQAPANWRVYAFKDANTLAATETVTVTEGNAGTNLGTFTAAGSDTLNSLHRVAYGYNRWSMSAYRQWLNSAEPAGKWWKPQHKWDRPPAQAATAHGFLTGYSDDFLRILKPVMVRTALNTVTDSAVGAYEDTYDRVFLPALEQEFINPQASGVEGEAWDYWKEVSPTGTPAVYYKDGAHPATYSIEAKTTARYVRLRSAYRGSGSHAWGVNPSGSVYNGNAYNGGRCSPACVIRKS